MSYDRLLVRKILEKPHEHEWSIQGLGMLRLYLSPAVRLHVWDPRPPHKIENVSELHNHPWDFLSTIIVGRITNHIYRILEPVEVASAERCGGDMGVAWMAGTIECGPNPKKRGACDAREIRLAHTAQTLGVDDRYAMDAATIHRSEPVPGTVTVCYRLPKADPDHAMVCWPVGTEWVSAEPRPATTDEVYSITKEALALMAREDAAPRQ